ncbi:hypothetical protein FM038_018595 [Shewanella eurypsychrophilus]|uniref:Uncharacterized protein n=1 Tax=Shewanella eurypsychrophilus TaxID=2593656 RepID=A0ABX6V9S7_9GAMM|nr:MULTISPECIES: hypothetical protein [Shewanella]QFU23970.1 hypothetical protein FS418_20355 [Shewanella sp. YLB-09]QPG59186.1 hypothetical protein FM038_018595 [Shewanella eurypsychrophilus]
MLAYLRFGLILFFIGGIFSSPVSASFSDGVKVSQSKVNHTVQDAQSDTRSVERLISLATSPQAESDSRGLKQTTFSAQDSDIPKFVPLIPQRLISFAHHEQLNRKPDYRLAFEFTAPLSPSFAIGYRIDFASTLNWALQVNQNTNRLSGWKESNLLYRFSQTRSA